MSQTLSPSLARCYGMARVARVWKISRASVYRSLKETPPNTIARRPGPVGACSDAELAEHIRQHIAASRLHGEGYRKLWARLRFAGVPAHAHDESCAPNRRAGNDARQILTRAPPAQTSRPGNLDLVAISPAAMLSASAGCAARSARP